MAIRGRRMTGLEQYKKWINSKQLTIEELDELKSIEGKIDEIEERFSQDLQFGTAGLRGIMELGTNRMNEYVVRKTTQGVAQYLLKHHPMPTVVISYDSRNHSRDYAEATAQVLSVNGIKTFLFSEMMPVPVLSFAIRYLNCTAGIMITASHNSKEYNGYKVYNSTGGQILDDEATAILTEIEKIDIFTKMKPCTMKDAMETNCEYVEKTIYDAYLQTVEQASCYSNERDLSIVYTPLNGSGRKPVQEILKKNHFSVFTVPEQEMEDGNFTTCPSPNPEKKEVYDLALSYAKELQADIIIATDPDCDRVGAMIKSDEDYVLLTGNEIGILLLQYLCECSENANGKYVCTSIVSTLLVDSIVKEYKLDIKRTHVGFKYIGEQIEKSPQEFFFGFEESNGYLIGDYARDKDGVVAANLLCQMAAYYKANGMTLIDVLESIYEKYGFVMEQTITITVDNQAERQKIMSVLRDKDAVFDHFRGISELVDYEDKSANTGLTLANVVKLEFNNGARLIVRPSGTEPKVKIYISAKGSSQIVAVMRSEEMLKKLNKLIGVK